MSKVKENKLKKRGFPSLTGSSDKVCLLILILEMIGGSIYLVTDGPTHS